MPFGFHVLFNTEQPETYATRSSVVNWFSSDGSLLQTSDLLMTLATEPQNLLSCLLKLCFLLKLDGWAKQGTPLPSQGRESPLNGWLVQQYPSIPQRSFLLKSSLPLHLTLVSLPSMLCIKLYPTTSYWYSLLLLCSTVLEYECLPRFVAGT